MPTFCPPRLIYPAAYEGEVVDVSLTGFGWRRSETNPDGLAFRIAVQIVDSSGEPATVMDCIDIDRKDRLRAVCEACGIEVHERGDLTAAIQSIHGRRCRVAVKTYIPRAGRSAGTQKSAIGSWLP